MDKNIGEANPPKKSPFKELKSIFGKKKGKSVGESSNQKKDERNIESFEQDPNPQDSEYETKTKLKLENSKPKDEPKNEMENIVDMSMQAYKKRIREGPDPGVVQPAIPATATFKLKGHILSALKDVPFSEKDYEDA